MLAEYGKVQAVEDQTLRQGVAAGSLDRHHSGGPGPSQSPGPITKHRTAEDIGNKAPNPLRNDNSAPKSPQVYAHVRSLPLPPHPHLSAAIGSVPPSDVLGHARITTGTTSYPGTVETGVALGQPFRGNSISLDLSGARPSPIGPIQPPIGRPRAVGLSDSASGSIAPAITPKSSGQRVLGSAALSTGDDDEVIVAPPRRISQAHGGMRQTWSTNPPANGSPQWSTPYVMAPADIWSASPNLPWTSAAGPNAIGTGNPRFDSSVVYPRYGAHEKLAVGSQGGRHFGFDSQ